MKHCIKSIIQWIYQIHLLGVICKDIYFDCDSFFNNFCPYCMLTSNGTAEDAEQFRIKSAPSLTFQVVSLRKTSGGCPSNFCNVVEIVLFIWIPFSLYPFTWKWSVLISAIEFDLWKNLPKFWKIFQADQMTLFHKNIRLHSMPSLHSTAKQLVSIDYP